MNQMSQDSKSLLIGIAGTSLAVAWAFYAQRKPRQEEKFLVEDAAPVHKDKEERSSFDSLQSCIYCDYNATTPIYPEVYEAMNPFLTKCYGNPSSSHVYGQFAHTAMVNGRKQVAQSINTNPDCIYFMSCGTEADNYCIEVALYNYALNQKQPSKELPVVITSSIEHPAILCYLRTLKLLKKRIDLIVLPVDSQGFILLPELEKALSSRVAFVTIMHSNNETGTIQPIRAMARIIKRYNKNNSTNILFHTDAAQSMGKVMMDVNSLEVDMMTIVGHKFGAPKGVAALYVRPGVNLCQFLIGGGQEKGFRAGETQIKHFSFQFCKFFSRH
jgi:cysteine desulfurase